MKGADGWWQKVADRESKTLHSTDGGKTWLDVSPADMTTAVEQQPKDRQEAEFLQAFVSLCPLDGQRAWLAFPCLGQGHVVLEYTSDGGQHWKERTAPVTNEYAEISFRDERRGSLLLTSGPALGHVGHQESYGTDDGGRRWYALPTPAAKSYPATAGRAVANQPSPTSGKPVMTDRARGWWREVTKKKVAVLHTEDGGTHWRDVSPADLAASARQTARDEDMFLPNLAALCVLDAHRAWVAYRPPDLHAGTALTYTDDGGSHWREMLAPVEPGYDIAFTFADAQHGFLLGGERGRTLFGTEDGGSRWYVLCMLPIDPEATVSVVFRSPTEGWITSTSLNEDGRPLNIPPPGGLPLYHTTDGGAHWQPQSFDRPATEASAWANIYAPVFIGTGKKRGYLPVEFIPPSAYTAADSVWVTYESQDGGRTWHLPARHPSPG